MSTLCLTTISNRCICSRRDSFKISSKCSRLRCADGQPLSGWISKLSHKIPVGWNMQSCNLMWFDEMRTENNSQRHFTQKDIMRLFFILASEPIIDSENIVFSLCLSQTTLTLGHNQVTQTRNHTNAVLGQQNKTLSVPIWLHWSSLLAQHKYCPLSSGCYTVVIATNHNLKVRDWIKISREGKIIHAIHLPIWFGPTLLIMT